MGRLIVGTFAGVVAWLLVVAALGIVVGFAWPQMAAIRDMTLLTFPMLVTRLSISAIGSIAGGVLAANIGRDAVKAPLGAGVLLLIVFVPYHLTIWNNFPVWYHLTFFLSLPVMSLFGGWLTGQSRRVTAAAR